MYVKIENIAVYMLCGEECKVMVHNVLPKVKKLKSQKLIYIVPSSPKIQRRLTAGIVGWAARGSMVE